MGEETVRSRGAVEGVVPGGGGASGSGGEPEGWVVFAEGVVVGGLGGVLIGGVGSGLRLKEGKAGGDGIGVVAGLAEEVVGGEGEEGGEGEGEYWKSKSEIRGFFASLRMTGVFDWVGKEAVEGQGGGEGEDGGLEGKQAPGELEEGQFREVMPEGEGDGGEKKGDDGGEDGEGEGEAGAWAGCEEGDGGDGEEEERDDGGGVEDVVVEEGFFREAGVVEEGVVVDAHAGEDDHGDLDVFALERGGEDVEGGEGEAQEGSGCGGEG